MLHPCLFHDFSRLINTHVLIELKEKEEEKKKKKTAYKKARMTKLAESVNILEILLRT